MKARRITGIMLAVFMLMSLMTAFMTVSAAEKKTVSNDSPCILANVGDKINLLEYSVEFDDGKIRTDLHWKKGASAVTSVTCREKGVTELTAVSGRDTKTVYLVAKEKNESEYVLYETDFSEFKNISDMKKAGWQFEKQDSFYQIDNNGLLMGNYNDDYVRTFLPEWLADFRNYDITAEMKMLTTLDNSRWCAIAYRIQNENGKFFPYYHMCIRENTTSASGVEFAERTVSNNWNVITKAPGKIASMKSDYHKARVNAYGNNVQYLLDGDEVLYVENADRYKKGLIGLTMNFGTLSVRNVRVTVQDGEIVRPEKHLDLINNKVIPLNLLNKTANIELVEADRAEAFVNGKELPGIALIEGSYTSSKYADMMRKLSKGKCIPGFIINTNAEADAVVSAMNLTKIKDVFVASEKPEVIRHARDKKSILRGVLVYQDTERELSSKEADKIRIKTRGCGATAVIYTGNCTKQAVSELQALSVAVWGVADSKSDFSVLSVITAGCNGIISDSAEKTAETINKYFDKKSMTRTPLVIGHRGNPSRAPENSLLGYKTAFQNGADIVENDIHLTKDNRVVIMHDDSIDRTTNGKGNIPDMTLAEIKKYNIKNYDGKLSDEKIPTIEEFIDMAKTIDCRVFIEIKGNNAQAGVEAAKVVKQKDAVDRISFISFNPYFLDAVQKEIPGISTGLLMMPAGSAGTKEDAIDLFYQQLSQAQDHDSTINISSGPVKEHYIQAVTDRGQTLWPWTYNKSSSSGVFMNCPDGITTNDAQWFRDMYKFIEAEPNIIISGGNTAKIKAHGVTYGGRKVDFNASQLIVKVIDGEDNIRIDKGEIAGLKDGNASILVGYKTRTRQGQEYILYANPVTVKVGDIKGLVFSDRNYKVKDSKYVVGVTGEISADEFMGKVVSEGCTLRDRNGKALTGRNNVMTGATIECEGIKYIITVKGDVNGDGKITASDYAMLKRFVLETYEFDEKQLLVSDINGDGKVIASDYAMLKRAVLETYELK